MTDQEPFSFSNQKRKTDINDMPSLEPTAQVPAIHSDKLNDPSYWNDKIQGKSAVVPPEHPSDKREVSNSGWKKRTIAGTAILAALAGGIGLGVKAMGGNDTNTEPRVEPSVSAPANPGGETTVNPTSNPSDIESVAPPQESENFQGLSTEIYTDAESLAIAYISTNNVWLNSGNTLENVRANDYSLSPDSYAAKIAAPGDEKYIAGLFVDSWQDDSSLAEYIIQMEAGHQGIVRAYMATADSGDSRDLEPFKAELSITSVSIVSETSTEIVVNVRWLNSDNRSMNRAADFMINENNEAGGETLTFIPIDGVWKVSYLDYYAG